MYIEGQGKTSFNQSIQLQDSVIRRLEIIGEAVKNLPQDYQDYLSERILGLSLLRDKGAKVKDLKHKINLIKKNPKAYGFGYFIGIPRGIMSRFTICSTASSSNCISVVGISSLCRFQSIVSNRRSNSPRLTLIGRGVSPLPFMERNLHPTLGRFPVLVSPTNISMKS